MSEIPLAPIDRLIRDAGAKRVSEDAARALAEELEAYATRIAEKASKLAQHAKRKTVTPEDIRLASKS